MPAKIIDRCVDCAQLALPTGPDGPTICAACLSTLYVSCDFCRRYVKTTYEAESDQQICADCAELWSQCYECDRYAQTTYATDDGISVCPVCVEEYFTGCDLCDNYSSRPASTQDGMDVCASCVRHSYWECSGCDELVAVGDECCSCEDRCDLIHSYEYKPPPVFHGDGNVYLGLELETSVDYGDLDECAYVADHALGELGYLKNDCSIDHGFEIVTHPMSYRWAMDHFPWHMLRALKDSGCEPTSQTGMHVHISRAAFDSPCHAYRWMKFLHRNSRHVTRLARRVSPEWASFDSFSRVHAKEYAKGAKGMRYTAINTQNDATFELRVFASSLTVQEVKAALGLADASVEYTRELTVSDITRHGGWDWDSFVRWLTARTEYSPLAQELRDLACAC